MRDRRATATVGIGYCCLILSDVGQGSGPRSRAGPHGPAQPVIQEGQDAAMRAMSVARVSSIASEHLLHRQRRAACAGGQHRASASRFDLEQWSTYVRQVASPSQTWIDVGAFAQAKCSLPPHAPSEWGRLQRWRLAHGPRVHDTPRTGTTPRVEWWSCSSRTLCSALRLCSTRDAR